MTTLMVQTDKLLQNFRTFCKAVGKTPVIPVLSGGAYGLGCTAVAQLLYNEGVRFFAVSRLEDALQLREQMMDIQILLLSVYSSEEEARQIVQNDLIAAVGSYDSGVVLSGMAQQLGKTALVHLKFDTGHARMGFHYDEVQKAVQVAKFLPNLKVGGVYGSITHTECKRAKRVARALSGFEDMLAHLRREQIDTGVVHLAGSVGALKHPKLRLGAVRCGTVLAGELKCPDKWGFQRVGRLVSNIADLTWLPEKQMVGVSNSFRTRKAAKIALVPTGYVDGLCLGMTAEPYRPAQYFARLVRALRGVGKSRKIYCDINGKRARVVGRVDLETVMVDVSRISCKPGDLVSFDARSVYVNGSVRRSYV